MGTQSEWVYSDIQTPKVKTSHKISLVSPRMDVDVTGVSLKNMRTHLIDHPRDEGLKHREQLWNFQQRYRGAIGKLRRAGSEDRKCDTSGSDDPSEEDSCQIENLRGRVANDQSSLPSRFRKRLKQKINITGLRTSEYFTDSDRRSSSLPQKDQKEEEKVHLGIQRLYSSGLIVKNTLYNQIRNGNGEERRGEQYPDNSRILEAIHKYGSLDKLPDITYPGARSSQSPNIRFLKTLSTYNRRLIDQANERRHLPLRRSFTNISDFGQSKRKLILVSRRGQQDGNVVRLGCIGAYNEEEYKEVDGNNDDNGDDDDVDDDDDDDDDNDDDDDDECDNENQVSRAAKLQGRVCDQKRPEHIDIRCNITHVNTQDDMVLLGMHKQDEEKHKRELRPEKTFHDDTRRINVIRKEYHRTDLSGQDFYAKDNLEPRCNSKIRESWNNTKVANKDKYESKENSQCKISQKKKINDMVEKETETESDDSLDIPKEKFGSTTHSIDKKLAIRKPWEWKPSPYRWIDKPYIKESDKPYIERIINTGEVIDEFHYDSFARTRPLKVQNFPEGAGYRDRFGVMR